MDPVRAVADQYQGPERGGAAGMCVGLVALPATAQRIRSGLSPLWSIAEMWHPREIASQVYRCHVVVYAPEGSASGMDDQILALRGSSGMPLVIRGPVRQRSEWSGLHDHAVSQVAVPGLDDKYMVDIVLDAAFRPLLRDLAERVRMLDIDPLLGCFLADLIEYGVRPFREAAAIMTAGQAPFIRRVKDVGSGNAARGHYLRRRAHDAGVDLQEFLHRNTMLQGVMRYVPDRGYKIAVRLNYASVDAFRMAMTRGLRLVAGQDVPGLKELSSVGIRSLADRVLGVLGIER